MRRLSPASPTTARQLLPCQHGRQGNRGATLETLVAKAESGAIDTATLRASYDRILAVKGG